MERMRQGLIAFGLSALAGGAEAEVRVQKPGVILVGAGAICPPSVVETVRAPNVVKGQVSVVDAPFQVAVPGDSFAASPDMGIAIVVRLSALHLAAPLTGGLISDDRLNVESWPLQPFPDGTVAIGLTPDKGEALKPGSYRLAVYGPKQSVFVYRFTIFPATDGATDGEPDGATDWTGLHCGPQTS